MSVATVGSVTLLESTRLATVIIPRAERASAAAGTVRQVHGDPSSPHVDGLTALRGVASLFVLMLHSLLFFRVAGADVERGLPAIGEDWQVVVQKLLLVLFSGDAAVTLFFVLSGCVLAMSLERKRTLDLATLRQFYVRRIFRIYPALWLSNLFGLVALVVVMGAGASSLTTEWMRNEYAAAVPLLDMVKGLLGLQATLNQPLWSILIELILSFLFPLIFWLTRRPTVAALSTGIAIGLLLMPLNVKYELDIHVLPFVVGAILPTVTLGPALERRLQGWWPWLCVLAVALVILPRGLLMPPVSLKSFCILLEVTGSALLIFALLRRKVQPAFFATRTAVFLGDISYSIYLLHFPILFMIGTGLVAVLPGWIAANGMPASLLLALCTLVVTIPVAAASYRLVEMPGQRLQHLLGARPRGRAQPEATG